LLVALLQCAALGQQRALVDDGAQVLVLWGLALVPQRDESNVQVARDAYLCALRKHYFGGQGLAMLARLGKGQAHALGVVVRNKGHQRGQRAIALRGLERAVRHGVGLHHHVVLVQHHQRQGHAGKQRLKALGGALCRGLAVLQDLVLCLQLHLVSAQFGNQGGQGGFVGCRRAGLGLQAQGLALRQGAGGLCLQ
jgi:hypothetical protein